MAGDQVGITIQDEEIRAPSRERPKAPELVREPPELVGEPQFPVEFRIQLLNAMKEGDEEKLMSTLQNYSNAEKVTLSDIVAKRSPSKNTLLHVAAGIGNFNILQALLSVIRDPSLVAWSNDRKDTALHIAARAGKLPIAQLLLNKFNNDGKIVDERNHAGNTALHEAVKSGNCKLINLLLDQSSKSVTKKNGERKCPLYLAVETGEKDILSCLLEAMDGNEGRPYEIEGLSPVHGAVLHRQLGMLEELSEKKKELFDLIDDGRGTPLHLAAYENYIEGVNFLVRNFAWSAFEANDPGYLPIHVACKMGHLKTIKTLLQHWPDPEELLTSDTKQNILHVAAKHGRASVVKYILGNPELEKLINAKDWTGNTPLHVATYNWRLKVLFFLSRDNRVDLKLVNRFNFTALDIVDNQLTQIEGPLRQSLTWTILVSAGVPNSKDNPIAQAKILRSQRDPPSISPLKEHANVRMVIATLIAGVTFAAGFSVPGGYKSSEPDVGIATLLNKPMYDVFVICNSIAMYNSVITVVILLWTQINDSHAVFRALRMTRLPLLIALATMSMAFMAGVHVTISKRTWIAIVALIIGITALFGILILYIALFIPLGYKCRLAQLFADYIIRAAILISREDIDNKKALEYWYISGTGLRGGKSSYVYPKGTASKEGGSSSSFRSS